MTFTLQGVDTSLWQDDESTPVQFDFNKTIQNGGKFCFQKVGQGSWLDPDYLINWHNAKLAGIPRGGYWFLDNRYSAVSQAILFAAALHSDPGELPPVADYERTGCTEPLLKAFIQESEQRIGKQVMIYTSLGFWNANGSTNSFYAARKLWLARYTSITPPTLPPWIKWTFWQWTSQGDGPTWGAESTYIDLNWYWSSLEQFEQEFGVTPPGLTLEERVTSLEARVTYLEQH